MIAFPADTAAAVQELWCGVKRMDGTFLHSPLLEELKSLEVRLVRQAYRLRKGQGSADSSTDSRVAAAGALQSVHSVSVDLPVQVSNPRLHACPRMQLPWHMRPDGDWTKGFSLGQELDISLWVLLGLHSVRHTLANGHNCHIPCTQLTTITYLILPQLHCLPWAVNLAPVFHVVQGPAVAETVELPMLPSINSGSAVQHYAVSASAPRAPLPCIRRPLISQDRFICSWSPLLSHRPAWILALCIGWVPASRMCNTDTSAPFSREQAASECAAAACREAGECAIGRHIRGGEGGVRDRARHPQGAGAEQDLGCLFRRGRPAGGRPGVPVPHLPGSQPPSLSIRPSIP